MNRSHYRELIGRSAKKLLLFFALSFLSFSSMANEPLQDKCLSVYSYTFNELTEACFELGGIENEDGVLKLRHAMRSPDGVEGAIDPMLLDLLFDIKTHFKVDTIELISGYRSPDYNSKLIYDGRTPVKKSVHQNGMAADIHFDEISEEALQKYAEKIKKGGVGFYPCNDFVHVDTGEVRKWQEVCSKRQIVGLGAMLFLTDKNDYIFSRPVTREKLMKKIKFDIKPPSDVTLERSIHNEWNAVGEGVLQFGKYRFRSSEGNSNEFYIKRR